MATTLIFDDPTDITEGTEPEPDNDSDDTGFFAGPPAGSIDNQFNGADPIVYASAPNSMQEATTNQAIANQIAADDGETNKYSYVTSPTGDDDITFEDSSGNVINWIDIGKDGTTMDETAGPNGAYSDTTVDYTDSGGHATEVTEDFNSQGQETGTQMVNPDGSEAQTTSTVNPDSSETIGKDAEFDQNQQPITAAEKAKLPSGPEEENIVVTDLKETAEFYLEQAAEALEKSPDTAKQVLGQQLKGVLKGYDIYSTAKNGFDLGTLGTQLYDEYKSGQPMAETLTKFASKAAETALGIIGVPMSGTVVNMAVGLGNKMANSFVDYLIDYQTQQGTAAAIQKVYAHYPNIPGPTNGWLAPTQPAPALSAPTLTPTILSASSTFAQWF